MVVVPKDVVLVTLYTSLKESLRQKDHCKLESSQVYIASLRLRYREIQSKQTNAREMLVGRSSCCTSLVT